MVPADTGQRFVRAYLRDAGRGAHGAASTLVVYVESDGATWPAADLPPADPTPKNALALRLAVAHPGGPVAYLGRPCQYLDDTALEQCDASLWAGARFSERAVAMMDAALGHLAQATGARQIALVGYSGGGTMAALLAARRLDVECLV